MNVLASIQMHMLIQLMHSFSHGGIAIMLVTAAQKRDLALLYLIIAIGFLVEALIWWWKVKHYKAVKGQKEIRQEAKLNGKVSAVGHGPAPKAKFVANVAMNGKKVKKAPRKEVDGPRLL